MVVIADRSFREKANAVLIPFLKTVGTYVSTKPEFAAFSALGTSLLAEVVDYDSFAKAVRERDLRQLENRDNSRKVCVKIALEICTKVNDLANNDPAVITAAGLNYVEVANPARPIGSTAILDVKFNASTKRVEMRVRKADKAADYRTDLETPTGEVLEEYAAIALTKGTFPAPKTPGTYRVRVVPRDSRGNTGQPTGWEDLGVS